MSKLNLKIITPKKIIFDGEVLSVTAPSSTGEITILPYHVNLLSLLVEGILKIKKKEGEEEFLAIGGGYLQTDGREVFILVSRAYGQEEINEEEIKKAMNQAKEILSQTKEESQRKEAAAILRRSIIDLKLLKKRKPKLNPSV
jgi:F-type H+-transporting ATPase subunit epsilon